jgi:hypothetical protein
MGVNQHEFLFLVLRYANLVLRYVKSVFFDAHNYLNLSPARLPATRTRTASRVASRIAFAALVRERAGEGPHSQGCRAC